jgi:hypothetical protein
LGTQSVRAATAAGVWSSESVDGRAGVEALLRGFGGGCCWPWVAPSGRESVCLNIAGGGDVKESVGKEHAQGPTPVRTDFQTHAGWFPGQGVFVRLGACTRLRLAFGGVGTHAYVVERLPLQGRAPRLSRTSSRICAWLCQVGAGRCVGRKGKRRAGKCWQAVLFLNVRVTKLCMTVSSNQWACVSRGGQQTLFWCLHAACRC